MMKSTISALLAASLLALPACHYPRVEPAAPQAREQTPHRSDETGDPAADRTSYEGPRITADALGPRHRIVLTAPTGGWSFELDNIRVMEGRVQAFVTARRPPDDMTVTQALERHEIETGMASRRPLDVFARIVEPPGDPTDFPYRRAAQSEYRLAPEVERQ